MRRASEILFNEAIAATQGLKEELETYRRRSSFGSFRTFATARMEFINDLLLGIEQIEHAGVTQSVE
jgi:hypothetical protein